MSERALVRNAADPEQVKHAGRKVKAREARFLAALQRSLEHVEVRLVFAELLERAGLYGSVYDHSGSLMAFKEGRRNFGLEIRTWLEAASEALTDKMDIERRQRKNADDRELDAVHTPRVEDAGYQGGRDDGGRR